MLPAVVRDAVPDDVAAIAAIYDEQVRTAISTFDLEPPPVSTWAAKVADDRPGFHAVVATDGSEVLGFAYSSTYRPRPGYDATREVSVYLAAGARGRGVGSALYDVLLGRLRDDGMHTALAVVALPNDASEALHRSHGFERVGVLPEVGFKLGRWIDVAFYALLL